MAKFLKPKKTPGGHQPGLGGTQYKDAGLLALVSSIMAREDETLRRIRVETPKHGLPPISIGPEEGKILDMLVRACGAKKAIEIGTLAGYSACWIAGALPPEGRLDTIEYDMRHAAIARENIHAAGLDRQITLRQGMASEILPTLSPSGPYDFCFIDADKVNYPLYLRWAIDNLRPGGIVVGDNAYLFGKLHLQPEQAGEDGPAVMGMRRFLETMADPDIFSSCAMIPIGEGMAVAVRK